MSIIKCYEPNCDNEVEVSCKCTSPEIYSCKDHLVKHCTAPSNNPHAFSSIILDPVEGTKEVILNFLKEQKSKTDVIKTKIVSSFSQTIYRLENIFDELLKEIDSDSIKINSYLDRILQTQKISKFEQDLVLNLLALQSSEIVEKANTFFPENKNIELFYNMSSLIDQIISSFNEEKEKVIRSRKPVEQEKAELNFDKELKNAQLFITNYKEIIMKDPNNDDAYNKIGNILFTEKRYEEAIAYYNYAIYINQNQEIYYINKGNALSRLERKEEAMDCYKEAIRINPNQDVAYNAIGNIMYNKKIYTEALNYYNDAIRINPNNAIYYRNIGDTLRERGRREEAMEYYKDAIRINPNEDGSYNGIGKIFYFKNQYEKALKYYNDAIRINPSNALYYKNKEYALRKLGKREEAQECYNKAYKIGNTFW